MSLDVFANVTRDNSILYQNILFQIDRMSEVEAMTYSMPPYYSYNGFLIGNLDIRQNDYILDRNTNDPITGQPKAYQIVNEPEHFIDHIEFQCIRADRAQITRGA